MKLWTITGIVANPPTFYSFSFFIPPSPIFYSVAVTLTFPFHSGSSQLAPVIFTIILSYLAQSLDSTSRCGRKAMISFAHKPVLSALMWCFLAPIKRFHCMSHRYWLRWSPFRSSCWKCFFSWTWPCAKQAPRHWESSDWAASCP